MHKRVVEVRGVRIGEGIPKIIVPIVGATREEILAAAASFRGARLDIVEWRADWFAGVSDFESVQDVLEGLRSTLGSTPLLFTFRTRQEGGEREISPEAYARLNLQAAQTGLVDLVDIEAFSTNGRAEGTELADLADVGAAAGDGSAARIIAGLHAAGVKVVASSHDFAGTPEKDLIVGRLRRMQELGADIPKIAVMPQSVRDVLVLLSATEEMAARYADRPIITMSMAGTGLISRLCGEVFGSACTFGTVGKASAPGQIPAEELDAVLGLLHGALSFPIL